MGEVVADICGAFCGAIGLAFVGTLQAYCNQTPCGLTICRCCDKACACGCCWKGDKGPLPMEDYPGGANHPDTIAAEEARRQADGEKAERGAAPPPPYDAKAVPTTQQPRANDSMKNRLRTGRPSETNAGGSGGASSSDNTALTIANNNALLASTTLAGSNDAGSASAPDAGAHHHTPVHHPVATAPSPAVPTAHAVSSSATPADYGGSSSGGGYTDSSGGGYSGGSDSGGGGGMSSSTF